MKVDLAKKLHQKKYRTETGCYLVEGEHLLLELEKSSIQQAELFVTEAHQHWPTRFRKTLIGERQMAQLSDTRSPQGLVAVVPMEETRTQVQQASQATTSTERVLYLYQIQDPGNLGTILRTLAWFGGWRLLLSPDSVDPFNPKVVRSSMGATFHVPVELEVTLEQLAARYPRIATLDMTGAPLSSGQFSQFDAYLFGNEARGVPHALLAPLAVTAFTIPGSGQIESLNLASAVNMSLYELHRG
ncbi:MULTISPECIES: RNA methyltransferase [unclassified Oceanobacter]|uniref:TrmH family RNA methyltransferase n=2 Tax=Gammaproteobacteria TaxID=1236 RepID=UPI0026E21A01|nr:MULTISPECIES: TrmH family RNA methyltransferase [unclassified Oceanobacter]MDO6681683.1 TrmH family RNA methyltransferase [Oceanobacter sp. 5_MG-2023]MDP2505689.1 TrmH family RNA methyltransferase [Oceanobacter sp. 3_MG-2023]MDP2547484.1 TrmH family RNA methyltransferase [Oceanobacter sp. 4_MG-2023]MDP2608272.1 TrmH family RNA methyltransferase [Oceanobacter sp. 1_MG-2023]MDP2612157.1 TrmH family RNA methyltransferase [Oceanobacter sp. 2_MG-2023]